MTEFPSAQAVDQWIIFTELVVIAIILYFLPTFISRKKENASAIFFLNLITGWTIVGYIACFIWACVSPKQKEGLKNVG